MHLVPKSKLYGQPAIQVRNFLRRVGVGIFEEDDLRSRLGITAPEAQVVISGLLAEHYIDHALPRDGIPHYGLRAKGGQLASASFAPQITRAAGDELLAGVLKRAADIESQPFVFRITKLALFGSMLGNEPLVSDVDLALAVAPRFEGTEFDARNQQRIHRAEQGGKRFRSMIESVVWPRVELTEYLRGRSRYVSIHSFMELELLKCPFTVLFEDPKSATTV